MPLPLVFGTEHELVVNIQDGGSWTSEKFDEEMIAVLHLIKRFHKYFFPDIPDDLSNDIPPVEQFELFKDGRFSSSDRDLVYIRGRLQREHSEHNSISPRDLSFFRGFMTPLGSRYYIDHGYFEYSSPECDDPFVSLACQIAQEELIAQEFEKLFGDDPRKPRLYKNVSDGRYHSQAAHRNFCVSRGLWERLVSLEARGYRFLHAAEYLTRETKLLATWHVVEQILCGAGKYGNEYELWHGNHACSEKQALRNVFQISGRADFTQELLGEQTTSNRPIINRRDEPLADKLKYGRYHCICGDATRAEWPHLFKMGLTALVLGMLEDDALDMDFCVAHPITAMREVSLDPTCKRPIRIRALGKGSRQPLSPIKIMSVFLAEMERYLTTREAPEWCGKILEKAKWAVWALEHEPRLLGSVLDWKIKELAAEQRPNAFNIHLNYHALAGSTSLYRRLYERGMVETAVSRDEIEKCKNGPPETTRAYFRGNFIKRFYRELDLFTSDWYELVFQWSKESAVTIPRKIQMLEPLQLTKKEWGDIFESAHISLEPFENLIVRHTVKEMKKEDE